MMILPVRIKVRIGFQCPFAYCKEQLYVDQLILRMSPQKPRSFVKVALGVCFALKSWKEYLLLFTYLLTLGKDVTLPLITKFKTNRPLSNLFVNRILN